MALLIPILLLAPVNAPGLGEPVFDRDAMERLTDGVGMATSATIGGLVGGLAGWTLFCDVDDDVECIVIAPLMTLILGGTGMVAGGALLHTMSDGDGSTYAAIFGGVTGLLAGALSAREIDDASTIVTVLAVTTGVGTGIGYALSDNESLVPTIGALPDGAGRVSACIGLTGSF